MIGRRRRMGFTLVEVLVALVIVALGSAAVLSALTTGADSTARLRERSFAEWVASNRLVEARVGREAPKPGTREGELEFAGSTWQWREDIGRTPIKGMLQIRVSARPKAAVGEREEWLVTLIGFHGASIAPAPGADAAWDVARRSPP
ncbi:MAG: type II secretion system minor pseudopilin GspI [Steroidobacteraceae bacterium]